MRLILIAISLMLLVATGIPSQSRADDLLESAPETAAPPAQMKGWVLFTWQTNRGYYFSLLPGTNRAKSWVEVNLAKVMGWDALRNKLRNVQPGEVLEFGTETLVGDVPSERELVRPPADLRRKIARLSKEVGFKLGAAH